jgi:uncharacterized protein YqeY
MPGNGLRTRISTELKDAMKAKDATRIATLRLVSATLKDREIAARDADGPPPEDDDAEVLSILSSMVRQREESIRAFEEGGRLELAAKEQAEIDVIRGFLPRPMTEAEVAAAIAEAIAETEAASIKDMGRVIGALKARHPGRMDFGKVGPQVKAALV